MSKAKQSCKKGEAEASISNKYIILKYWKCNQKSSLCWILKRKDGPNKHVKHNLGMDLSLLRRIADIRVSADVGYVYFTHALIDVTLCHT